MKLQLVLLTITANIYIACGQNDYELEFLEENIFTPCENYPDNFLDQVFDMSNAKVERTEDGSLVVNGFALITKSVEGPLPLFVEVFKKERGTWQPTVYSQMRDDTCTASFSKLELWHSYWKHTPEDQLTCPYMEGQKISFDINEPTIMSFPQRNGEGEYKIHATAGSEGDELFICVNIFAMLHKM